MSSLKLMMPEQVLMNDDIHGQCTSGDSWPHIVIKSGRGCNFKIERQRKVIRQGTNVLYFTHFVVKSVTATCEYMCAVGQTKKAKIVVVSGMYVTMHAYQHKKSLSCMPYRCINITNTFKYKHY